ncbi:MAG: anthranilate synthase component I family protein [Flavobacteriaceae bacterium]|nr:anthranilate synthase component I family protein [Flavobacteriaceae bacterium]
MLELRTIKTLEISNIKLFKDQLLNWAQGFDQISWLDSNHYDHLHQNYDAVLAVDANNIISVDYDHAFQKLTDFRSKTNDWIFGYLAYDLKNDIENLRSDNYDGLQFPDLFFFQPKKIFFLKDQTLTISYLTDCSSEMDSDMKQILADSNSISEEKHDGIKISLRTLRDDYFKKLNSILEHIHRGDIYEVNFCQEFYSENTKIEPLKTFNHLNDISRPPFASFLRHGPCYAMSASPERYLKKMGTTVISQPIKGTAKRSDLIAEDEELRLNLEKDEKERSENIMIVDLVRNDLSRTARKGSVSVDELCAVFTFEQVHQMISTIRSEVDPGTNPVDIIKSTFPMGSMTGAPKISAMTIIEAVEDSKRGLYSGAIGYIDPKGDFDFNVVIRSILYNADRSYVSYSVGGAITAKSNPVSEYEECLLKAKAMRVVLEQSE